MKALLYLLAFFVPIGLVTGAAILTSFPSVRAKIWKGSPKTFRKWCLVGLFLALFVVNAIGIAIDEHTSPIFIIGFCVGIFIIHCFFDDRL